MSDGTVKNTGNDIIMPSGGKIKTLTAGSAPGEAVEYDQVRTMVATGSQDNRVLRADGTGGHTVQNSLVSIDDAGKMSGLADGTATGDAIHFGQAGAATDIAGGAIQRAAGAVGKYADAGHKHRVWMPNYEVHVRDDLDGLSVLTQGLLLPRSGLIVTNGGTAVLVTNTATEIGYHQLRCGTSTTGAAFLSSSATGLSYLLPDAYEIYMSVRTGIPTLSNGTEKYKCMFGFSDTITDVTGTHSLGFFVDQTTPVNNWMVAIGDGSVTPAATGSATVPIVAAQLYHLEIYSAAGSGTFNFYIDGVLVHTTSSGIPKTTPLGFQAGLKKNAGSTTTGVNFDWVEYAITVPSGRATSFLA